MRGSQHKNNNHKKIETTYKPKNKNYVLVCFDCNIKDEEDDLAVIDGILTSTGCTRCCGSNNWDVFDKQGNKIM